MIFYECYEWNTRSERKESTLDFLTISNNYERGVFLKKKDYHHHHYLEPTAN